MSEKRFTVIVTTETIVQSVARDLLTVFVVGAPIVLNELTIASTFLNFCFGAMLIVYVISRGHSHMNNRIVRGATIDDLLAKLKTRMELFERGEIS